MSELQQLINRRLDTPAHDVLQYRVTVRLPYDLHHKLLKLAAAFNMSKTATCEDITCAAIGDAWAHYTDTLESHELHELLAEMQEEDEQEDRGTPLPGFYSDPAVHQPESVLAFPPKVVNE